MNHYVCGFYLSWDMSEFLLIKKTHPEWQKGKWNGVGGKIEHFLKSDGVTLEKVETPPEAMVREFYEETGITTKEKDWTCFYIEDWKDGPDGKLETKVYYFATFGDATKRIQLNGNLSEKEAEQENIEFIQTHTLIDLLWNPERYIWNLRFLIPMIIFHIKSEYFNKINPQGVNSK